VFRLLNVRVPKGAIDIACHKLKGIFFSTTSHSHSHLVQLKTGEGKSIVLGVVAAVLALLGFDVDCVSYSKYLSSRDEDSFSHLFDQLGVKEKIKYGTLTELSKRMVDRNGDVRGQVRDVLQGLESVLGTAPARSSVPVDRMAKNLPPTPRVLLIDEVDVFLSEDFYGELYRATTAVSCDHVRALQHLMYKERASPADALRKLVKESHHYKQLAQSQIGKFLPIVDNEISKMLQDVRSFDSDSHKYRVSDGKIAYDFLDTTVTNVVAGYQTLFAYMKEFEMKRVAEDAVKEAAGLRLKCGSFSYAEIPLVSLSHGPL
jgi:hypothetical protein